MSASGSDEIDRILAEMNAGHLGVDEALGMIQSIVQSDIDRARLRLDGQKRPHP